jgi:hypothetical protein
MKRREFLKAAPVLALGARPAVANGDHRPIEPAWDVVAKDFDDLATTLGT